MFQIDMKKVYGVNSRFNTRIDELRAHKTKTKLNKDELENIDKTIRLNELMKRSEKVVFKWKN